MAIQEAQRQTDQVEKPKTAPEGQLDFPGYKIDGKNGGTAFDGNPAQANKAHEKLGFPSTDENLKTLQMAQFQSKDIKDALDKPAAGSDQPKPRVMLDVFNHGASPGYAQDVANGIASLPEKVAQELKDKGIRVDVFKDIHAYDRAMGTNKAGQKVFGKSTALDAPAFFDSGAKPPHIAVFENLGDGTPVKSFANTDHGGLARHEAGHAYSYLRGFATVRDQKFQAAMGKDVDNLTPAQTKQLMQEVKPGGPMAYYLGQPSKEEFYAEAFAVATGRGSDKKAAARLKELFPNTLNYLRDSTK